MTTTIRPGRLDPTPGTAPADPGTPSTLPRPPRFYDPTTDPYLDETGTLHVFSYAAVHEGLIGDDTLTVDLSDLGPESAEPRPAGPQQIPVRTP